MKPTLSTIIFDYGGVLGLPLDPAREAAMERLARLPHERFQEVYQRDRIELDRGTIPTDEYWRRILAAGGVEATPALLSRIEREDALGWSRVNHRVVEWSSELRDAGVRTAILSNMPFEKLAFMRSDGQFRWIDDFQVTVFSCDCRLVKPEPSIYRLCLERLGAQPEECLFLDDVAVNVEGARAVGLPALQFTTSERMTSVLEKDWGLPVRRLRDGRKR